jgi:hypothetical protein
MTKNWAKRIQKIDSILRSRSRPVAVFRYGPVKYLPKDTVGERHVGISRSEPTALAGVEQCEFEELPGAASVSDEHSFHVYLSLEDEDGNL